MIGCNWRRSILLGLELPDTKIWCSSPLLNFLPFCDQLHWFTTYTLRFHILLPPNQSYDHRSTKKILSLHLLGGKYSNCLCLRFRWWRTYSPNKWAKQWPSWLGNRRRGTRLRPNQQTHINSPDRQPVKPEHSLFSSNQDYDRKIEK